MRGWKYRHMRISQIISITVFFIFLLVSCSPGTEELYLKAGKLQEQKKYKEAIEFYTKILKRNSKFQDAVLNKGYCYFMDSNYVKALDYYEYLLRLKGVEETETGVTERNATLLESQEVIDHEVSLGEVYRQVGITKYHLDSLKSAFIYLQRAIDHNNEIANCLMWQGIIWTRTDSVQKCCTFFQRAKELGEADADRLLNLYCQKKY